MSTSTINIRGRKITVSGFSTDDGMVVATITVGGRNYECAEYYDCTGVVNDTADSHMNVNGIYNAEAGHMEPFTEGGMDLDDYLTWSQIETFVRTKMHEYIAAITKLAAA